MVTYLAATILTSMPALIKSEGWTLQYASAGSPYIYNVEYTGVINSQGVFFRDEVDVVDVSNIVDPDPEPEVEPLWHYGLENLGTNMWTTRYGVTGTPGQTKSFTITYKDGDTWYRGCREGWMYSPGSIYWEREKLYWTSSGIVLPD